jgi:hypothetical protein
MAVKLWLFPAKIKNSTMLRGISTTSLNSRASDRLTPTRINRSANSNIFLFGTVRGVLIPNVSESLLCFWL